MELSFGTLILGSISGSIAYGIQTENSDVDLRGIYVHKAKDFFGYKELESNTQSRDFLDFLKPRIHPSLACYAANGVEGIAHELRQFLRLAIKCNPNILECLFCERPDILYSTGSGSLLLENRHLFLSQLAKNSYFGYARNQAKNSAGSFEGIINFLTLSNDPTWFGISRTKLRKQLSHCYRLLSCGLELLQEGDLYIVDRYKTSLAIRNGTICDKEIARLISSKFKEFNDFDLERSPLPEKPDYDKIRDLCCSILSESYGYFVGA